MKSTENDGRDNVAFISEGDEAVEVGEEFSECGFLVNRCYVFSVITYFQHLLKIRKLQQSTRVGSKTL